MDSDEALRRLIAGNQRFVSGELVHPHEGPEWRRHLTRSQAPIATVLGCSDAVVPPEIVFDQGLGDLFVIRVAGNVIASDVLGSVQFAGHNLGTRLFVVLGHDDCGVVKVALERKRGGARQLRWVDGVVDLMTAGLEGLGNGPGGHHEFCAAVEANVRWSVKQISSTPEARLAIKENRARIVGAIYESPGGRVRFLD